MAIVNDLTLLLTITKHRLLSLFVDTIAFRALMLLDHLLNLRAR
jgi:hypothetical protein